jgi:hypothetical protein
MIDAQELVIAGQWRGGVVHAGRPDILFGNSPWPSLSQRSRKQAGKVHRSFPNHHRAPKAASTNHLSLRSGVRLETPNNLPQRPRPITGTSPSVPCSLHTYYRCKLPNTCEMTKLITTMRRRPRSISGFIYPLIAPARHTRADDR